MRCPSLSMLPEPSANAKGWPWTEESPRFPDTLPDGLAWPKISIVTPSLNQGQFIEETIRSVLLQGYPNLEFIIIDGGSTDNSLDIIKKYEPWLTYWESAPDRGQSHAINKGFSHASGEILAWINSDDSYNLCALGSVASIFIESHCDVLSGNTIYIEQGKKGKRKAPSRLLVGEMLRSYLSTAPQPSTFWRRMCWQLYGPLDETLHYRMDYTLFLCFAASDLKWVFCNRDLSFFRHHEDQKTWTWSDKQFHLEREKAIRRFTQYDDFARRYSMEIRRGLHYEGWLVSWMAVNNANRNGVRRVLKMLTAPLHNWRCIIMPFYYRKTFGKLLGVLRGWQKFSHKVKKTIRGNNNTIVYKNASLSSVIFDIEGSGNRIEIMDGCGLKNVTFYVRGDNHRVFIDKNCMFRRGGTIWIGDSGCSLSIGENSTFEDVHLALTEPDSQVRIGQDCMFAYDIDVRTGDSHSIIDVSTGQRINYASNITIEDHVWVARRVAILKGVTIGKDSIVAIGSIVTKDVPPESLVGGVPARVIRSGVTWMRERIYGIEN